MKEWLKSFFQNFVKNLKTIIFALVIAVIVWFAISMQIFPDVTTHISDIPVEVKATEYMTENALSVTNSYVDKITVQETLPQAILQPVRICRLSQRRVNIK